MIDGILLCQHIAVFNHNKSQSLSIIRNKPSDHFNPFQMYIELVLNNSKKQSALWQEIINNKFIQLVLVFSSYKTIRGQ